MQFLGIRKTEFHIYQNSIRFALKQITLFSIIWVHDKFSVQNHFATLILF